METYRDHKHARRAVAPIIATLLMVAIAVVGGILIFVFAQGFFTDTNIGTPNIESLEIFGYDSRDTANLFSHLAFDANSDGTIADGEGLMTGIGSGTAGSLADADEFVVYIRNKGAGPVTIDTVKVYGAEYAWAGAATLPTAKKFSLTTNGGDAAADQTSSPVLEPGQEATLIISYEEDTNGKIKIGRPIPVVIITGSGATFTKQLQNGVQLG